jgi:hypothetical protein
MAGEFLGLAFFRNDKVSVSCLGKGIPELVEAGKQPPRSKAGILASLGSSVFPRAFARESRLFPRDGKQFRRTFLNAKSSLILKTEIGIVALGSFNPAVEMKTGRGDGKA